MGQLFTHNNLVASMGEGNNDPVKVFRLSTLAKGRFLTVQRIAWGHMEMDEINVGILMVGK